MEDQAKNLAEKAMRLKFAALGGQAPNFKKLSTVGSTIGGSSSTLRRVAP
jgi:hypothetical protein